MSIVAPLDPLSAARTLYPREGDPPRIIMLVGMPKSGKTTWRKTYIAKASPRHAVVISLDDHVEQVARKFGLTYSQAFERQNTRKIDDSQRDTVRAAVAAGYDVLVDRVNPSFKSRAKWLRLVPEHYERHAVVFDLPEPVLRWRRSKHPEKTVPKDRLAEMRNVYQEPEIGEFDYVHAGWPPVG